MKIKDILSEEDAEFFNSIKNLPTGTNRKEKKKKVPKLSGFSKAIHVKVEDVS